METANLALFKYYKNAYQHLFICLVITKSVKTTLFCFFGLFGQDQLPGNHQKFRLL